MYFLFMFVLCLYLLSFSASLMSFFLFHSFWSSLPLYPFMFCVCLPLFCSSDLACILWSSGHAYRCTLSRFDSACLCILSLSVSVCFCLLSSSDQIYSRLFLFQLSVWKVAVSMKWTRWTWCRATTCQNDERDRQLREGAHQGPPGRACTHPEEDVHQMG